MNVLSLFAGIGGLDLGLERAGFRTVAFVEREAACKHWLGQHWPGIPIHDDVRTFSGLPLRGLVDLVCGGFPCQPFSVAGKQKGTEDERHLWPEMSRIIREVRPRWVLAENVPGLRTIAADLVLKDLEGQGYTCWPLVVGVDDVGGPHRRKRVWIIARKLDHPDAGRREQAIWRRSEGNSRQGRDILPKAEKSISLAYRDGGGREGERIGGILDRQRAPFWDDAHGRDHAAMAHASRRGLGTDGRASGSGGHPDSGRTPVGEPTGEGLEGLRAAMRWPSRPGEPQHAWEAPRLAHTANHRRHGRPGYGAAGRNAEAGDRTGSQGGGESGMADSPSEPPRRPGQPRQEPDPRESESPMGGAVDGLPSGLAGLSSSHRREALKALGNAVCPWNAYVLGRAIMSIEQERAA